MAIKEDCFRVSCQTRSALRGWSRATANLPVPQSSRPGDRLPEGYESVSGYEREQFSSQ